MRVLQNKEYRNVAEELARRVASELGDQVDAIVLYGSVARGDASEDSDIDILVIGSNENAMRNRVHDILHEFDGERGYMFFISLTLYSREEFLWLSKNGSPFIAQVLRDRVILRDNGTFSRIFENRARVS